MTTRPRVIRCADRQALSLGNGWLVESMLRSEDGLASDTLVVRARCPECGVAVEAGGCTPDEYFALGARIASLPSCTHTEWVPWAIEHGDQETFGLALQYLVPRLRETPSQISFWLEDSLGIGRASELQVLVELAWDLHEAERFERVICEALSAHYGGLLPLIGLVSVRYDARQRDHHRVARLDPETGQHIGDPVGLLANISEAQTDAVTVLVLVQDRRAFMMRLSVLCRGNRDRLKAIGPEIARKTAKLFARLLHRPVEVSIGIAESRERATWVADGTGQEVSDAAPR